VKVFHLAVPVALQTVLRFLYYLAGFGLSI
jgi:hypothetical protein